MQKIKQIAGLKMLQWEMPSMVGTLYLVASARGLHGLSWAKHEAPLASALRGESSEVKILKQTVEELKEYFAGKRKVFSVPLVFTGTDFQQSVWKQLKKIPYGKTYSYAEMAQKIANPKAMRAVGNANGKNPFCIVVPCHRVIAANGSLGGFSGGLDKKIILLDHEKQWG
jgi:methylated-DNA-[protein]-cysteine S-methyltransferase